MLPGDDKNVAHHQAEHMISPRIAHFHDPAKRAGNVIEEAMGARSRVTWNIFT